MIKRFETLPLLAILSLTAACAGEVDPVLIPYDDGTSESEEADDGKNDESSGEENDGLTRVLLEVLDLEEYGWIIDIF